MDFRTGIVERLQNWKWKEEPPECQINSLVFGSDCPYTDDNPYGIRFHECEAIAAKRLNHHRPVLDADGVPVKVGDTVYAVGCEYRVSNVLKNGRVRIVYENSGRWVEANTLTHTKPEPDSWEKLKADIYREERTCHIVQADTGFWECDRCGGTIDWDDWQEAPNVRYCPNCGAMVTGFTNGGYSDD